MKNDRLSSMLNIMKAEGEQVRMKKGYALWAGLFLLTGCSGNGQKEKIDFRTAVERLQTQEISDEGLNRIGLRADIETLDLNVDSTVKNVKSSTRLSVENLNFRFSVSGLVEGTKGDDLSGYASLKSDAISVSEDQNQLDWTDLVLEGFLDHSNFYVDASDKNAKQALIDADLLTETSPDKFYVPLDFSSMTFPLLSIGKTDFSDETDATDSSVALATSVLAEFVEVYVSDEGKDYEFRVDVTAEKIVDAVKKIEEESGTGDASLSDSLEIALTSGGFQYIRMNVTIDDYRLKKCTADMKVGYQTMYLEDMTSSTIDTFRCALTLKGEWEMDYGDRVVVPTLTDREEFTLLG